MVKGINAQIRAATGGTMRLSGTSKRGQTIRSTYDMLRKEPTNPGAIVKAVGSKFQLIERDTRPHRITPRRSARFEARQVGRALVASSGGRVRRSRARRPTLSTPYGPRPYVDHPGTKGKHPFENGVRLTAPQVPRLLARQVNRSMAQVFR